MRKFLVTAAFLGLAGPVLADITAEQLVEAYQAEGFARIEVEIGLSQIKVEAIRDSTKVEVVYDMATGDVLERETERVEADDDTTPGVEITSRDHDFLDDEDGGEKEDRPRRGRDDAEDFDKEDDDDDDAHDAEAVESDAAEA